MESETMTAVDRLHGLRERWREGSLTLLLPVQVVSMFGLVPVSALGVPLLPALAALLLLMFMSLTITAAHRRWAGPVGVLMLILGAATTAFQGWYRSVPLQVSGEVAGLATFLLLSVVVLQAVFGPGRFTGHRIRGAVVFYLNLGLLFAFAHRIVAELAPGSYKNLPPMEQTAAFRAALDYFSFTTLTSVGYGDILPVAPVARALCTLNSSIGRLPPTILIARVVTITLQQPSASRDAPRPPGH